MDKMTTEQFGASVRLKYPEYARYSNKEIAEKMLVKYPQYADAISDLPQPEEKSLFSKVGDMFTGSTRKLGETIGQLGASSQVIEGLSEAEQLNTNTEVNLRKQIQKAQSEGRDTTRLKTALSNITGRQDIGSQISDVVPAVDKTAKQVIGEAVGTGVEAMSGGVLSGIRGLGLSKVAPTALAQATSRSNFLQKTLGGRIKDIAINRSKDVAQALPFGYAYDVAQSLQEDKSGASIFRPGMGSLLSAVIPLSIGGLQVGRQVASKTLEKAIVPQMTNISPKVFERLGSGRLTETKGLVTKLRQITPEQALDDTRASATAFKSAMQREFGTGKEALIAEFTGKRIGLDDKTSSRLLKIAERFGFDDRLPQNLKNMSAKESIDLLTEINAIRPITDLDDPLVRSLKLNLADVKKDLMGRAVTEFGGTKGSFQKLYQDYSVKSDKLKDIQSIIGKVGLKPNSVKLTPIQHKTATTRLQKVFNDDAEGYLKAVQALEDETGSVILDKIAASQLSRIAPKSFKVGVSTLPGTEMARTGLLGLANDIYSAITFPLTSPRMAQWVIRKVGGYDPSIATKLLNASPSVRNAIYNAVHKENMAFNDAVQLYATDYIKNPKFGLSVEDISKRTGFTHKQVEIYNGEKNLTTKTLQKLKGRTTVSKQFISDLTNSPDLKQAERDLFRRVLAEYGDNTPLAQEARKYKSAEEFVGKMKGSSTQYGDYAPHTREYLPDDFKNITELGVDPEEMVTIYRGIDKMTRKGPRKINDGDFVTSDFDSAASYAGKDNVVSMEVKAKHLYNDNPRDFTEDPFYTGAEYVYSTKKIKPLPSDSQLTDIWEKASKGDQINVKDFANKVKSELLPLKPQRFRNGGMYENITLPDELRGPVASYEERVYQSPIKTSAGGVHYGSTEDTPNYFAHSRIEDLPNSAVNKSLELGENVSKEDISASGGTTRRVIEIQSDLFQKGRLEEEMPFKNYDEALAEARSRGGIEPPKGKSKAKWEQEAVDLAKTWMKEQEGVSKLEPYRNTWHERVIKEEVKKAAEDGKTKLQFPTGETAMKIEGLGGNMDPNGGQGWHINTDPNEPDILNLPELKSENMKVGQEVIDISETEWIITEVLGDGKFKAVQKDMGDFRAEDGVMQGFNDAGDEIDVPIPESMKESFDISGKVDTNNPIYKFYEKEVGKYLKNKYNAELITDPQGVKWWEITVDKKMKGLPVEAFAVAPIMGLGGEKEE